MRGLRQWIAGRRRLPRPDRRVRARSDSPWTWIHRRTVTWRRPALAKAGRAVEATALSAILRWDGPCRLRRTLAPGARRPTAGREGWLPESTEERVASRRRWVLAASTISAMLGPQGYRR